MVNDIKMKMTKHCDITERDYLMMRFLWKWKAVSTQALAKRFFTEANAFTAYRRLLHLASDGFIGTYQIDGPFNKAWILKEKGFKHILPYLGDLHSKGYKSTTYPHDFLATAFHLGDWLTQQPDNTQTYSEQQLRCYPADLWPDWIPRSTLHRPDGYSAYQSNDSRVVIAFEAEISPKAKNRYESVVTYYDSQPTIQYAFWLVDSKITLNCIRNNFEKLQVRDWSKHQFMLLSDFKQKGWMASFIDGKLAGRSPFQFLCHNLPSIPAQSALSCGALTLLDSRTRPIISSTYAIKSNA